MNTSSPERVYDVTFIGAGPTGLFGAFYAGLREMSVKVIDALPQAGGQLIALYPEKMIYDTPGFPEIQSKMLVDNLVRQAGQWQPALALGETALSLTRGRPAGGQEEDCWVIRTTRGQHFSRTVIISAGIGAFEPVKLKNESIERLEGRGVHYMVRDLEDFNRRRVLIIGGGDSAVDWALALEPIAEQVTLIHRREGFRAHDSSVNALMASSIDVRVFYELQEALGEKQVEAAIIFDNRTDQETQIPVDDLILALGFKADLGPIREWGLETIGRRYIRVNQKM
jgi:ferredoxin/flavodoxin---NADP+ reductase